MAHSATTPTGDPLGPTVFVLFGATGDLAKRMVLPAFYRLAQEGLLPKDWLLVGNGRGDVAHEDFRAHVHRVLTEFGPKPEDGPWAEFSARLRFAGGGFEKRPGQPARRHRRGARAGRHRRATGALPGRPAGGLRRADQGPRRARPGQGRRVVYEKPFGTSPDGLPRAGRGRALRPGRAQVFRIDHFLGKEATQNLHVLRFANGLFHAVWSAEHVAAVQIDVPEKLGVTDRAVFYDRPAPCSTCSSPTCSSSRPRSRWSRRPSLSAEHLQAAREAGHRLLPPARPGRGRARPVRRLPRPRRRGRRLDRWTPTSPPGCGSTTTAGAACRSCCGRASGWPRAGSGSAWSCASPAGRWPTCPSTATCSPSSLAGDGEIDLRLVTKKPGPLLELDVAEADVPLSSAAAAIRCRPTCG